jgi:hypothetical protein
MCTCHSQNVIKKIKRGRWGTFPNLPIE